MSPPSLKTITRRGEPPLAALLSALKSKLGGFAGATGGTWWKLIPAKLLKPFAGVPPSGTSISTENGSVSLDIAFVQCAEPLATGPACPTKNETEIIFGLPGDPAATNWALSAATASASCPATTLDPGSAPGAQATAPLTSATTVETSLFFMFAPKYRRHFLSFIKSRR